MLFMLRIDVSIPPEMPQADKDKLRERENARAIELVNEGTMVRIWRIVGRVANFSLWEAPTLEALHERVSSLPMFPYMKVDVTPLINHPVTEAAEAASVARSAKKEAA
jgi:muconolactone D-isomerase